MLELAGNTLHRTVWEEGNSPHLPPQHGPVQCTRSHQGQGLHDGCCGLCAGGWGLHDGVGHSWQQLVTGRVPSPSPSQVPKITVIVASSFGTSSYAMVRPHLMPRPTLPPHMHASAPLLPQCNRAMSPNFVFSWPHARMGMGDIGHTAFDHEEAPEMTGEECSWRLLDDGLILPHQTKEVCLLQLAWLYVHCPSYPSPAPPCPSPLRCSSPAWRSAHHHKGPHNNHQ